MERDKLITIAEKYLGQREISGPESNSWIMSLWNPIPWIWSTVSRKDDTLLPWCGAFIRLVLTEAGLRPPKNWFRAREYLTYGYDLNAPARGAIGVIKTGKQWHVGIIAGIDQNRNIVMIGGNQNDSVKYSSFRPSVFQGYRWPLTMSEYYEGKYYELPVINSELSTSQS
jgi:uncharacterized protein (TIGR02594 family)